MGKTKRGKGTKLVALAGSSGLPLAVHAASASPHEVTLVEATLAASFLGEEPERLIGDRAYDSDPLGAALQERGIEMMAPHRRNRKKPKTQDGRKLRRYKRHWKMECLFAWRANFRRLVVRYERRAENYLGFVRLGCIIILDVQLDRIDPSLLGFALSAIVGVDPRVLKPSGDASERQTFPLGFVIDTSTPTTASAPSCSASATISPSAVSRACLNGFS